MYQEQIKEAVDNMHSAFEEFKKTNAEAIKQEIKGYIDPLLKQKLDNINEAISIAEDAKEAAEKAQAIAKRQNEIASSSSPLNEKDRELKEAFIAFIRKGENHITEKQKVVLAEHSKALSTGSDPAGSYLVIPQFDTDVTRIINETSPIRTIATVKTISTNEYVKPQRVDRAGATWSDRDVAPTETTTPTWKQLSIKVWKLQAEPQISQDLLDDAAVDVEAELRMAVAEEFELSENSAFVAGDGVGQPKGFLSYAAGTSWGQIEQVVSGSASAITYNGLIDLVYALKDPYLARANFVMKRSTVAAIRKLVDNYGQPLWMPGFGSEPATLLGYPIMRAADMPAIASNALAIAFGDFSKAYYIIDRLGSRILVDPYTNKPFVKYFTTRRVGGGVNNFEAIKIQKIST